MLSFKLAAYAVDTMDCIRPRQEKQTLKWSYHVISLVHVSTTLLTANKVVSSEVAIHEPSWSRDKIASGPSSSATLFTWRHSHVSRASKTVVTLLSQRTGYFERFLHIVERQHCNSSFKVISTFLHIVKSAINKLLLSPCHVTFFFQNATRHEHVVALWEINSIIFIRLWTVFPRCILGGGRGRESHDVAPLTVCF